jgi:uncharacterized membrane protein YphA (DoxX/SURF4 family)
MTRLRLLTSPLPVPASWYAIPLRLIVGFGFIQHGYAKLARGPEDFIGVLHAMGLPSSFLLGWLTKEAASFLRLNIQTTINFYVGLETTQRFCSLHRRVRTRRSHPDGRR